MPTTIKPKVRIRVVAVDGGHCLTVSVNASIVSAYSTPIPVPGGGELLTVGAHDLAQAIFDADRVLRRDGFVLTPGALNDLARPSVVCAACGNDTPTRDQECENCGEWPWALETRCPTCEGRGTLELLDHSRVQPITVTPPTVVRDCIECEGRCEVQSPYMEYREREFVRLGLGADAASHRPRDLGALSISERARLFDVRRSAPMFRADRADRRLAALGFVSVGEDLTLSLSCSDPEES